MRMRRVYEIAPSATSTQFVVHALPADAPAHRGGNLSNSYTQFSLATVTQLLKEAGVDLPADASAGASGKPSEVTAHDADNLDLVKMPATFDYEGDETSLRQGLPPGEVGPQLCELELSDSDSDINVGSILGACLDGFNGDAWMSDAEEAQDNNIGAAAGVNDPGDISWRTTAWSAEETDSLVAKVAKRVGESRKQPASAVSGKTVTFDLQGTALSENDGADAEALQMTIMSEEGAVGVGATLTKEENKK